MGTLDKYCPQCGCRFFGQRTGKCPSCGESAIIEPDRLYQIHPGDIKLFDKLDKKGGVMKALAKGIDWPSKKTSGQEIEVIAAAEDGSNVTVRAQGVEIVFYNNNGRLKELSRIKRGASYYDPAQLRLSGQTTKKAYAIAAKTMETNQKKFQRRMIIIPGPDYR